MNDTACQLLEVAGRFTPEFPQNKTSVSTTVKRPFHFFFKEPLKQWLNKTLAHVLRPDTKLRIKGQSSSDNPAQRAGTWAGEETVGSWQISASKTMWKEDL